MAYKIIMPKTVWLGINALEMAEGDLCALGKKALIVSGKSMIRQGHMDTLTNILKKNNIAWHVFSEISGEPTTDMISLGAEEYINEDCDFIIGFGGGSPLDSAKAIALVSKEKAKLSSYMGREITTSLPPIVAIPSTAGTGSEVTQFTIITDKETNVKMLLKGSSLMPTLAIVDPTFTTGATFKITVATALDALTHAVEAYTSKKANQISDNFAISAVKKIFKYLPLVLQEETNIEYREKLSLAAYEAGVSFNNSSVTLVHGMSRPIGALFHVPHGLSNAMLLDVCLSYALEGAYERFGDLGRAINKNNDYTDNQKAAEGFLEDLRKLCTTCQVPTLKEFGIKKEDFIKQIDKMAEDAMESKSPSNTRRDIGVEDIKKLYLKLWEEK